MDKTSEYVLNDAASDKTTRDQLIDDFAGSFAHAAFQTPIDGLTQLANKAGADLPTLKIVNQPEAAPFGSTRWHMQQVGSGFGAAVPFLAINKGMSMASGGGMVAAEMTLGRRVGTAAMAGFVNDSIFRPVADDEQNFGGARLKNGLMGAATFAALTGVEAGLNGAQARMLGVSSRELAINASLGRTMATHFAAGGLVGAGNGQAESLLNGKGFASLQDTAEHAYQFAFIGATMGGFGKLESALAGKGKDSSTAPRDTELAAGEPRSGKENAIARERVLTADVRDTSSRTATESPLQVRLRDDVTLVTKDSPEGWLVPNDKVSYEQARDHAVDRMKRIYDGEPNNLHDLVQDAVAKQRLTPEQAKAYEFFMGDMVHGFETRGASLPAEKSVQEGNLQHTLREARSLLQDPALQNAKPEDVFKALVSSAMSDARKPAGLMAVANHAYVAAVEVNNPLGRALEAAYGETLPAGDKARIINDCSNIVLEHHLQGPRKVLGGMIHLPLIRQSIAGDITAKMGEAGVSAPELKPLVDSLKSRDPGVTMTADQKATLERLGMKQHADEIEGLPGLLDKHLNAENYPARSHGDGPLEVQLNPAQSNSLRRIGLSGLFLPNPESSYYTASQLTSAADQVQYVTPIERSIKYDGMYGPEFDTSKPFRADKLGDGSNTAEGSYFQVRDRLSPAAQQRLDGLMETTRQRLPEMRTNFVSDWSRDRPLTLDVEGKLPFYDSKLKWVEKEAMKPLTPSENLELADLTAKKQVSPQQESQLTNLIERKHYEQAVEMNNAWIAHLVKLGETRGLPSLTITGLAPAPVVPRHASLAG